MTAHRVRDVAFPVTFHLDGHRVTAERGEPLAQALIAADKLILARSPKLHRPRGPACMRAACDGCLARVDGVPNVMTCLVPARGGEQVETQNSLGSRTVDLLRVTDWFFPDGFDHHHFLAGIPGVSPLMQNIARRIAGLGVMPTAPRTAARGERVSIDALVIGGGASGIACASTLKRHGLTTMLCDDGIELGGSTRAFGPDALATLFARCPLDGVDVRRRTAAVGIFDGEALLASHEGATVVRPRLLVLATGGHDGVALFEGNDVPGVFSARAAATLAWSGVAIGARVVVAGEGPCARALVRALEGHATVTSVALDTLIRVEGATRVGGVVVRDAAGAEHRHRADALAVDVPVSPSFELLEQAGADVRWNDPHGFFPVTEAGGRIAPHVHVTGEVRATRADLDALVADGIRVAEAARNGLLEGSPDAPSV